MSGPKENRVLARVVLGHESTLLDTPDVNGMTHRWTVFVRPICASGCKSFPDRGLIRKVEFDLHETFPNPHRIIKEPPFEVTECGFGSFSLPVTVHFNTPGPKASFKTQYELILSMEKYASNAQDFVCELRDVSDSFLEQIAKYCPTIKKKKRPSGEIDSPPPPILPPPPPKIAKFETRSETPDSIKKEKKKKKEKEVKIKVETDSDKDDKKPKKFSKDNFKKEEKPEKEKEKKKVKEEKDKSGHQKEPKKEKIDTTSHRPESVTLNFASGSSNSEAGSSLVKPSLQKPQAPIKTNSKKEKSITDSSPSTMMTSSSSERSSVSPRQGNTVSSGSTQVTAGEITKRLEAMKDENMIYRVCEFMLSSPQTGSMLNVSSKVLSFDLSGADSTALSKIHRLLSGE
ncbi:hypothetical protein WR25_10502 [Diploscapter pachys]|uniref:YEATS domain-containing protein n=1 Tax=Diploscapter pachys TaxID=2018661 RepID=A0A2A2JYH5_9BILA|nr:hypothetical protein WR25_10502 [Diploscapter pachys]